MISRKKIPFKINDSLREYLSEFDREKSAVDYTDLLRYTNAMPLINAEGVDTLWETVFYGPGEQESIHLRLIQVYANLLAHGEVHAIDHLYIDRIDICPFGNSKPFRIRIVNRVNDNFDYFYVKNADSSRIYGLELEHLLSPNRINYLVDGNTLIEAHIAGIPGDQFIKMYRDSNPLNKIRIAKEFVKFNERCFIMLLGDMHSSNFVVDVTPDFEEVHFRIRAIDFDQQSYEGRMKVYLPQFFKQNVDFVTMGIEVMTPESQYQYQLEERSLIRTRIRASERPLNILLDSMEESTLTIDSNLEQLRTELARYYKDHRYEACRSMGELIRTNLRRLFEQAN